MSISAKNAIKQFTVKLLKELPLDDPLFFAIAKEAGLFPLGTGDRIRAKETRAHKVIYFLQQVVEPAADYYLPILLKVMKESKAPNVEKIADDIQAVITPGMHINYFMSI